MSDKELQEKKKLLDRLRHEMAILAWCEAHSWEKIKSELRDRYPQSEELYDSQWQRLLKETVKKGFLRLGEVPVEDQLAKALSECYIKEYHQGLTRKFVVVDDRRYMDGEKAVYAKAAEILYDDIKEMSLDRHKKEIVIAITGGPTLSEVVGYLSNLVLQESEDLRKRLRFVSLNSASSAVEFHHSANFLAVRMAEIFGCRHHTVPTDDRDFEEYERLIRDIDLLFCGVGTRDGFLGSWLTKHDVPLPVNFIGDIALIPIDSEGETVDLSKKAESVIKKLSPCLSHKELTKIALSRRVLLVVGWNQNINAPSKVQVLHAALKQGYVGQCVIGAGLASDLIGLISKS